MIERGLWWPVIFAFALACLFTVLKPGSLHDDALQYDRLSQSILQGRFALDGQASMFREPGYPFFRAWVKNLDQDLRLILFLQAVLFSVSVLLIGLTFGRLDQALGPPAAWGAAVCYGAAYYASRHLFEILALCLFSSLVYLCLRWHKSLSDWRKPVVLGLISGALLLTRFSFVLLPLVLSVILMLEAWHIRKDIRRTIWSGSLYLMAAAVVVLPWMVRNLQQFGVFSVSSRSGIILYARGLKAQEPWKRTLDSLGLIGLGRVILTEIDPSADPMYRYYWDKTWVHYDSLLEAGKSAEQADKVMRLEGMGMIEAKPANLLRFLAWCPLDLMRFFALPSPTAFETDNENTFFPRFQETGKVVVWQSVYLVLLHVLQIAWWAVLVLSSVWCFKRYGLRYIPGILVLSYVLPHLLTDDIVRYSMPILPWVWAGVAVWLSFVFHEPLQRLVGHIPAICKKIICKPENR